MCVEINHRRRIWAFFCTISCDNFWLWFFILHASGNKSSAANLGLFCMISCDNFWLWFFILHARGNKSSAANLGLFLHNFVRQLLTWLDITLSQFLMIWMPCSAPRLNSKILNFSNNHFWHLTSKCFEKVTPSPVLVAGILESIGC